MANTLNLGTDGNWATKKGSLLGYNSENNNYKPLPFNFSRDSKATVINKDGLIKEVGSGQPRIDYLNNTKCALKLEPSRTNLITQSESFPDSYWTKGGASIQADPSTQGSELVTNGNFATDSDWTKGTGWTISGGYAESDGTNAALDQFSILTVGKTYKVVITVTNMTSSPLSVRLGTLSSDAILSILENGTYTVYGVAGATTLRLRSQGFDGRIQNVSVKEVQGFTSPDGTNNAYKLVEDTSNGSHKITANASASNIYTISVFAKYNGRVLQLASTSTVGHYANFDLLNGVIGNYGSLTENATITELKNGWYKCSMTTTSNMNTPIVSAVQSTTSAYQANEQGDGTSGFYIYGSQVEAGSYSTSYISTSGSAVTRLADVCNNGGNEQVINSTEGVLYFEGSSLFDTPDSDGIIRIENSSDATNEYLDFRYDTTQNRVQIVVRVNGSNQTTSGVVISDTTVNNKFALKYKVNDIALWVNGVEEITVSSASVPTGLDNLSFNNIYTKIKDIRVYNTSLSDSELTELTS